MASQLKCRHCLRSRHREELESFCPKPQYQHRRNPQNLCLQCTDCNAVWGGMEWRMHPLQPLVSLRVMFFEAGFVSLEGGQ